MTSTILPPELNKYSHLNHIKRRGAHEWSAECPWCGDIGHVGRDAPDRFRMFNDGRPRGWCRVCRRFEFADIDDGHKLTEAEIQEINRKRKRLIELERMRVKRKIEEIERAAYWRGYHDAMKDEHRRMWEKEGIPANLQDWWELGYDESYHFYYDDEERTSPALTIPYFMPSDDSSGKKIATIQYRLLSPPVPNDKYRFIKDLGSPLYLTDPTEKPRGRCLLVEGSKKAMVSFMHLGHKFDCVVASPSKYVNDRHAEVLDKCDVIYIALDPDANWSGASDRAAKILGRNRSLIATLPTKIDDMIVKYGASGDDVWRYVEKARSSLYG